MLTLSCSATSCGRAFEDKPAGPGVKAFVVFAHDDEVDVLRPFVLQRAEAFVIELHRAQIDVLLQLETHAQQDALFQNARLDVGMADRAEQDRRKLAQFVQHAVRQSFAGSADNVRRRDRNWCN